MIINPDQAILNTSIAGAGSAAPTNTRQTGNWMAQLERAFFAEQPAQQQAQNQNDHSRKCNERNGSVGKRAFPEFIPNPCAKSDTASPATDCCCIRYGKGARCADGECDRKCGWTIEFRQSDYCRIRYGNGARCADGECDRKCGRTICRVERK